MYMYNIGTPTTPTTFSYCRLIGVACCAEWILCFNFFF